MACAFYGAVFGVAACTEADRAWSGALLPITTETMLDAAVKNMRVVQEPKSGLCFAVTAAILANVEGGHLVVLNVPCKAER